MDAAGRGRIIRRARRRRGLSQAVLAGLIDRSESWLSQVERGRIDVDSHRVLTRLAEVLRMESAELTGTRIDGHAAVRHGTAGAIEHAMMRYLSLESIFADRGNEAPVDPVWLRTAADQAHAAYQRTGYAEAGRRLPLLIREAEAAVRTGGDRPAVCAVRARVYDTAAAVLRRVGACDLAWTAADRAMAAAEFSGDLLLRALGAYRLSYVFVARRSPNEAAGAALDAVHALEHRFGTMGPEQLSVHGGLHLAAATAAAAEFDRAAVARYLHQAQRAADLLGRDANLLGTAFGPANVVLHTVSTAVQLGQARTAVESGESFDDAALPPELVGRRAQLRLDLARGYTQRRMDAAAVNTLLEAESLAPQLVRCDPATAEVLGELLRREHRRSTPELRGLAQRVGAH